MSIIKKILGFINKPTTTTPEVLPKEEITAKNKEKTIVPSRDYYGFLEKICTNTLALKNSYQFLIGEEAIYINGKGDANSLSKSERSADAIIHVEPRLFTNMMKGRIPFDFLQNTEIKTKGDIGAIMKIQVLLNASQNK